ncbi:MAG: XRE family transcriptional regulator [Bacteroidetes bacterium]|nr:XRE family transcriptional regulator [Bacteroidota bacterium]
MQENHKIHIGKIIQSKMNEQGRRASWLARQLPCDRSNVYRIFKCPSIDTALLVKISEILNYNFFSHYTSLF